MLSRVVVRPDPADKMPLRRIERDAPTPGPGLIVVAATYAGTTWNSAGSRPAYRSSKAGVIDPGQPSLRVRPT